MCLGKLSTAQQRLTKGPNDTIIVRAIVVDGDTMPHHWVREVFIKEKMPKWLVKKVREQRRLQEEYSRLRQNVYYVYPYAVQAAFILQDVDSMLHTLNSKDAKKIFKERKEQELNKRFKHELTEMSTTQGQILVKLIARETGKPCYQIVKELKGGFNAGIWQTVALIFDNNLKNKYDPQGDDAAIESIVQEILSKGHFERRY